MLARLQLVERSSAGAAKAGYLHKYRGHAESSLWANTWEIRYVVVKGNLLTYFKKEQDVQFPPRGQIDLQARTLISFLVCNSFSASFLFNANSQELGGLVQHRGGAGESKEHRSVRERGSYPVKCWGWQGQHSRRVCCNSCHRMQPPCPPAPTRLLPLLPQPTPYHPPTLPHTAGPAGHLC